MLEIDEDVHAIGRRLAKVKGARLRQGRCERPFEWLYEGILNCHISLEPLGQFLKGARHRSVLSN